MKEQFQIQNFLAKEDICIIFKFLTDSMGKNLIDNTSIHRFASNVRSEENKDMINTSVGKLNSLTGSISIKQTPKPPEIPVKYPFPFAAPLKERLKK